MIDYDMTFEEYVAAPGLNKSAAVNLLKTPAHFQAALQAERKHSAAQNRGLALHCKLSNDRDCLAIAPKLDRRTKAGKDAWLDFELGSAGKIIVTPDVDDQTEAMAESVTSHPIVRECFSDGRDEVSVFATWQIPIKCRIDRLTNSAIVDWKTCSDITGIDRTAAQYHYDMQAAWYRECVHAVTGKYLPFVFVFVEDAPPYSVRVLEAGETMLERGMVDMRRAVETYIECQERGEWPAWPAVVETLELPAWAQARVEDVIEF
jgi:exodeoxyribonuclease VIII